MGCTAAIVLSMGAVTGTTATCMAPRGSSRPGTPRDVPEPQEKILTITHAPIEAIGWPEMTTDFSLAQGVDTANVGVGDRVYFVLIADSDGIYAVTAIGQVARGVPKTGDAELIGEGVIAAMTGRRE